MAKRPVRKKGLAAHLDRPLLSVLLSIISLTFMVSFLVTETLLMALATGLSVVATAAQVRMMRKRQEQQRRKAAAKMPPRPRPAPAQQTGPCKATAEQMPTGVVLCTDTHKPIDDCDCATRHVATRDGAHRYGLDIGSPMGRKKKTKKPSMTKSSATR